MCIYLGVSQLILASCWCFFHPLDLLLPVGNVLHISGSIRPFLTLFLCTFSYYTSFNKGFTEVGSEEFSRMIPLFLIGDQDVWLNHGSFGERPKELKHCHNPAVYRLVDVCEPSSIIEDHCCSAGAVVKSRWFKRKWADVAIQPTKNKSCSQTKWITAENTTKRLCSFPFGYLMFLLCT